MSAINDILQQVDVNQLASILGTDPRTAESAAQQAVSTLVDGMESSAGQETDARQFANALGQHMNSPVLDANGGINLDAIDVNDGAKIVNHVVPAGQQQALFGGSQGALIQKLMPLLAPIVMAYLAKRLTQQGGLGSVLGSVLGGGQQYQQPSQGGMGDILGQILGGGQSRYVPQEQHQVPASQGGLGDILGSILGGGQSQGGYAQAPQQGYQQVPQQSFPTQQSGGLVMDDPGAASGYGTSVPQQQSGMPGGVGDVLKNILFGR